MQVVGHGREGSSSRVVGHVNVQSGAQVRDNSAVVWGAEAKVGGGRED